MQYRFLDPSDKRFLELAEMPVEGGIALAVRTTGYDADEDEVLELSIVDLAGAELFSRRVKPQNAGEWAACDATGGITPADVEDAPELYQFEEEISDLFENAKIVIGTYLSFAEEAIESSWVTLPAFTGADLIERFCECHCSADYPGQPATAAALDGIAGYYGVPVDTSTTLATAQTVAACYRALVREIIAKRDGKGEGHWRRHEERLAQEASQNQAANKAVLMREKRLNQMNGLLWVAAAIIFTSLIIQLYQRGGDVSFMVICGAFAVFSLIRAIANFRK